jgi:hypothetical protein
MFERLKASWKKFRKESHEYDVERAMHQQGGGAGPPSSTPPGGMPYVPPKATHDTDLSKPSDD